MLQPQAVIFDIGNVLIEWQPERFYDSVMPRAEREALFAEVDPVSYTHLTLPTSDLV